MDDLGARDVSGRLDSGPTSRLRPSPRLPSLQTRHPRRMFARFGEILVFPGQVRPLSKERMKYTCGAGSLPVPLAVTPKAASHRFAEREQRETRCPAPCCGG